MNKVRYGKTANMILCSMFAALFFVSSNIIPPVYILPGVPVTFQILVIALMTALLGTKASLVTISAIFGLTAVGVPMMSGFSGGVGAFMKPSSGFMLGWIFLIFTIGLYRDLIELRIKIGGALGKTLSAAGFICAGIIGIIIDYFCGALSMSIFNGAGVFFNFLMNIAAYTLLDTAKIIIALALSRSVKFALGKAMRHRLAK